MTRKDNGRRTYNGKWSCYYTYNLHHSNLHHMDGAKEMSEQSVYLDYVLAKDKYDHAQMLYDQVLTERERLFEMTQPKVLNYDKDRVDGGEIKNTMEEYLILKEKSNIDGRLTEAFLLIEDRKVMLDIKGQDLRRSKNLYDRIYLKYHIEKERVIRIARYLHYSESQIYRILVNINTQIQHARKCEKNNGMIHSEHVE